MSQVSHVISVSIVKFQVTRFQQIWKFSINLKIVIKNKGQSVSESGHLLSCSGTAKKRHGHNFELWGLKQIARPHHMVGTDCYLFQTSKCIIVAVSFFCNASYFWWRDIFFDSSTAYNSRSKPHMPSKFHIFGTVRMWGFTWSYPGYLFLWTNFEEWAFYEKHWFLGFFASTPGKIHVAADRTILKIDAFHIAQVRYAPFFSRIIWEFFPNRGASRLPLAE